MVAVLTSLLAAVDAGTVRMTKVADLHFNLGVAHQGLRNIHSTVIHFHAASRMYGADSELKRELEALMAAARALASVGQVDEAIAMVYPFVKKVEMNQTARAVVGELTL